ncbi:cytosine/adenosine deaminase-related metal-dependent hydrolase [Sphingobium subterraneum]|uniref:Cytosine/adenosine deaminase-related metal-dependent hydrolase n=2 Tax=Sphingobium subterraneum TaxID=627688 RepID=A0A841IXU9_9SPHN|nr:cytosine/adenosine deaminase-related metal-dependent hydrolase [Sphingobium subterraneum]
MDPAIGDIANCNVLIEDGVIAAIGPEMEADDAETIDARGGILLPGFVDTHRHTWQCLLRNAAVDWSLGQYLAGVRGKMGYFYSADDMYLANYLGALECLDSGITTLYDWSHNNNTPDHSDAAVRGLIDSGIRAVFGYGNANREWIPVSAEPTNFEDVRRIKTRYFSSSDGLLTMGFAARGPQYSTLDVSETDFRTAHELGLPITVHAGSGHWGKTRPVDRLRSRGLLYADTIYVHCCTLADDEMSMIADTGGHVSCAPEVELNMGQGWPATLRALAVGLEPTISIDVTTSIGGDMFSAMRAMMGAARAQMNAVALAEDRVLDKPAVTSRAVAGFATLAGARACGLGDRVGSVTVGKSADLIILRTDTVGMMPLNYPIGALIEAGNPSLVDMVMVAGNVVKRDGRLIGVDLPTLRSRVSQARDDLFRRANAPSDGSWLPTPHVGGTQAIIDDGVLVR